MKKGLESHKNQLLAGISREIWSDVGERRERPNNPAGQELRTTVLDRRQEEARAAMFSDWASASYAWNKEETSQGMSAPSVDFWTHILVGPHILQDMQNAGDL